MSFKIIQLFFKLKLSAELKFKNLSWRKNDFIRVSKSDVFPQIIFDMFTHFLDIFSKWSNNINKSIKFI